MYDTKRPVTAAAWSAKGYVVSDTCVIYSLFWFMGQKQDQNAMQDLLWPAFVRQPRNFTSLPSFPFCLRLAPLCRDILLVAEQGSPFIHIGTSTSVVYSITISLPPPPPPPFLFCLIYTNCSHTLALPFVLLTPRPPLHTHAQAPTPLQQSTSSPAPKRSRRRCSCV